VEPVEVMTAIRSTWKKWRWPVYALVLLSQLATGWILFLPSVLMFVGMLVAHVFVVRQPLLWLSPMRRLVTRLSLKLSVAAFTIGSLVVNVLVFPFVGANAVVVGLVGLMGTVVYVEGAILLTGNRLRREARGPGLDWWEWVIPSALLLALLGSSAAVCASSTALWYLVTQLPIPGIDTMTGWAL
jgi:hypothetical protein